MSSTCEHKQVFRVFFMKECRILKLGSLLKTWSNITEEVSVTQVNYLDHHITMNASTEDGSIHKDKFPQNKKSKCFFKHF